MSKLKDYLSSDLDTFLNTDEFAETHDIDGRQVDCVIDIDILQQLKYKDQQASYDGVYNSTKVLFVKAADMPDRPVSGQHIRVDGKLYLVKDCPEDGGMLEITLEANET